MAFDSHETRIRILSCNTEGAYPCSNRSVISKLSILLLSAQSCASNFEVSGLPLILARSDS